MLARRLLRQAASAQRRVAARHNGQQTRRVAVVQWHCHSLRWASSGNRSSPPSSHDGDESFADRADRVKHELSVLHSVAVASHDHEELTRLRSEAQREDLWGDPTHAASILQQLATLESRDTRVNDLRTRFLDAKGLYALAKEEHERSLMDECMVQLAQLLDEAKSLRVELLLAHASDAASCFVEIQAGAGGTESCDWVAMLARMYQRWGERRHFRITYADASAGEETGFRSVMLRVDGAYAYGWAKTEAGVHRLVRMSPFDSAGRRHTSFAQVRVYPLAVETSATKQSIEIPAKDLRIDTYRSSGAGGQHVNTTDSAVRITHLPTNTVVTCQSDRSQHRNKAEAMDMLRAKLHQRDLEQRATAKHAYTQGLGDNAWGSQIRSYVLQPYTLVKDHRTAFSVSDATSVLDGGHTLDRFMEEMLLLDASRGGATDEAHEQD